MTSKDSLRANVGRLAAGVIPDLEDRVFNRDRSRAEPASRAPRRGYRPPAFDGRTPHLVVVPQEGPQFPDWRPGTRNFYYEAYQSAREQLGDQAVSVLDVAPGVSAKTWHADLVDLVHEQKATHIITHIEANPSAPKEWTWDVLWNELSRTWDGALLGVMFDSAFTSITMRSRRLARMSPNFLAVDICMPMDGVLIGGRAEVGPVNMPVSQQSMALLDERLEGLAPIHDVSFIGSLYPFRVDMIEALRSLGVDVAVNPHRQDVTTDFASSRENQPDWLDYMAGLAQSRMTINFSRSSAGDFEQLKTRVIEAALAGTLLLTDDRDRTGRFFVRDEEFGFFADVQDLPQVVSTWLADPDRLNRGRLSAQVKARDLALRNFWDGVEAGLRRRSLPSLGIGVE